MGRHRKHPRKAHSNNDGIRMGNRIYPLELYKFDYYEGFIYCTPRKRQHMDTLKERRIHVSAPTIMELYIKIDRELELMEKERPAGVSPLFNVELPMPQCRGGFDGDKEWWVGLRVIPVAVGSDIRLKKNITKVGRSKEGHNVYTFEYIDKEKFGHGLYKGVMAQELESHSVRQDSDGYYRVNYDTIDVNFERIM